MPTWKWPDARGWIGLGAFILTLVVLALLIWGPPELRKDDFFKALATLIVGCYIKDVVGWAYQATKQGGELADHNAALIEKHLPTPGAPQPVVVANTAKDPAIVQDASAEAPADDAGLPEFMR